MQTLIAKEGIIQQILAKPYAKAQLVFNIICVISVNNLSDSSDDFQPDNTTLKVCKLGLKLCFKLLFSSDNVLNKALKQFVSNSSKLLEPSKRVQCIKFKQAS
ncbi:hypothetical protein TorRG33x02_118980 [Trema orientale]|uniref:Uncharacterized protein n=1 Tax=Trema orientale TaxID=63057 RepID=A0A2P5F3F1_TREOI|nr:hypothetical protein TorRG33x02_118980 [Trema orientale]